MKSNDLIALLIAVILIIIGVALGVRNYQSQNSPQEATEAKEVDDVFTTITKPADSNTNKADTLNQVALIHDDIGAPTFKTREKSDLEQIRDSIDWSDAPSPAPELVKTDDYDVYINVSKEYLMYVFDKLGYTGEKIDSGETTAIPPLLVVSISKGWSDGETVQFKKSIFYRVILSLVLFENEAVLRERDKLLSILEAREDDTISSTQLKALNRLAYSYRAVKEESDEPLTEAQIQDLLTRVDFVPASLALAQAAHESGYASSRFAHSANALFGQWDWSANAVKPQQQRKGMGNYGIKSFDQPVDSVRAYIWNLNTHRAYAGFRKERARQRGDELGLLAFDGHKLAGTLTSYSERGEEYTKELQGTISYNRLGRADNLRLMKGDPIYFN
jgi:Bax protein